MLRLPNLPAAAHNTTSRELKLLVDRREDLVVQRTSLINRFLGRVHELDPERSPKKGSMDRAKTHKALADWLSALDGVLAEVAADELADIVRLTAMINALTQRIGTAVHAVAPTLPALSGYGELTAAVLILPACHDVADVLDGVISGGSQSKQAFTQGWTDDRRPAGVRE